MTMQLYTIGRSGRLSQTGAKLTGVADVNITPLRESSSVTFQMQSVLPTRFSVSVRIRARPRARIYNEQVQHRNSLERWFTSQNID